MNAVAHEWVRAEEGGVVGAEREDPVPDSFSVQVGYRIKLAGK